MRRERERKSRSRGLQCPTFHLDLSESRDMQSRPFLLYFISHFSLSHKEEKNILASVGVRTILGSMVSSVRRWICISISIWVSLVSINWHQILHIFRLFGPFFTSNALGRGEEDDGRNEAQNYTRPGKDVGPSVVEFSYTRFL